MLGKARFAVHFYVPSLFQEQTLVDPKANVVPFHNVCVCLFCFTTRSQLYEYR